MLFFPTVDEDVQYFRSQGYTGSINDMHFKAMGDLGYTGSLNDRIHSYLTFKYGSYYEAMRNLRNGTSVFSLISAYAVNGFDPALVFDFVGNYFRKGSEDSTLAAATTYTGTSNGTMTDSDGLLKWKPHNVLKYSEDFSNSYWGKVGGGTGASPVVTANAGNAPDNTATADRIVFDGGTLATTGDYSLVGKTTINTGGINSSTGIWLKSNTGVSQTVLLYMTDTTTPVINEVVVTTSWQLFSQSIPTPTNNNIGSYQIGCRGTGAYGGQANIDVLAWGAHAYRSDLGGMVNNPVQPAGFETYVPTEATAPVYLPRTGNHVYNGTAWVNEGLLLESEVRTNLVAYSIPESVEWSVVGSTLSEDVVGVTSPDGLETYTKLIEDGATASHYTLEGAAIAGIGCYSCFAKDAGDSRFLVLRTSGSGSTSYIVADPTDGSVTQVGSAVINSGSIDFGNGNYRFWFTYDSTSNDVTEIIVAVSNSATPPAVPPSYTGDGTSGIYIWGAQVEAGSTPSSYIPTTAGATVTRAAETLTVAAANMPWPTPVETTGTELVTNGTFTGTGNLTGWTLDGDATNNNGVDVFNATAGAATNVLVTCNGLSAEVGKVYKITYDRISGVGFFIFGGVLTTISGVAETTTSYVVATSTGPLTYLTGSGGETGSMDNVSVKEINPLAVSIQMDGRMTYADTDSGNAVIQYRWRADANTRIQGYLSTAGTRTGHPTWSSTAAGVTDYSTGSTTYYSPDINVPFNMASRHGSTFLQGAVDGTAITANTTPVALPDLSAADFEIGYIFMGNIGKVRVWAVDLTDTGIAEATAPSTEPSLSLTFDGSETSFTVLDWSE